MPYGTRSKTRQAASEEQERESCKRRRLAAEVPEWTAPSAPVSDSSESKAEPQVEPLQSHATASVKTRDQDEEKHSSGRVAELPPAGAAPGPALASERPSFIPSPHFMCSFVGYVFSANGPQGAGYYAQTRVKQEPRAESPRLGFALQETTVQAAPAAATGLELGPKQDIKPALSSDSDSESAEVGQQLDTDDEMMHADGMPKSDRLCASSARQEYGVSDKQLRTLRHRERPNPHYRSAAPMRMYERREVIRLARKINKDNQYRREHGEEIAEANAAAARARAREEAQLAKVTVEAFKPPEPVNADSGLPLAWRLVMQHLAKGMNQDIAAGFSSPSTVFRKFCSLRETCREMNSIAVTYGLPDLASRVPATAWTDFGVTSDPEGRLPKVWAELLTNPMALRGQQLQEAARQVKVKLSGTKAQLVVRLLAFLELRKPSPLPAELCFGIKWERATMCTSHLKKLLYHIPPFEQITYHGSFHHVRNKLLSEALQIHDEADYEAAVSAAEEDKRKRIAENQQRQIEASLAVRRRAEERQEQQRQMRELSNEQFAARVLSMQEERKTSRQCICRQNTAHKCQHHLCANCCRRFGRGCARHS